jgi:hypothetical protein
VVKMTEKGWRAYREGINDAPISAQLMMELFALAQDVAWDDMFSLMSQVEDKYGSAEAAVAACKRGEVEVRHRLDDGSERSRVVSEVTAARSRRKVHVRTRPALT